MPQARRGRGVVLLTLGVITPIGILAVNASAFVMRHLTEFRVGIAACALISGLALTALAARGMLRLANTTAPPLYRDYRWWAMGVAFVSPHALAASVHELDRRGLGDPRRLPDSL